MHFEIWANTLIYKNSNYKPDFETSAYWRNSTLQHYVTFRQKRAAGLEENLVMLTEYMALGDSITSAKPESFIKETWLWEEG